MDRVRRTLCFASKAFGIPAMCLAATIVSAQQSQLQLAGGIRNNAPSEIRQVAANDSDQVASKSGLLQLFMGVPSETSKTPPPNSLASKGLLGTFFAAPSEAPKTAPKSSVPLPPTLKSKSSNVPSRSSAKQPVSSPNSPDWSGVPFHSAVKTAKRSSAVPLNDPSDVVISPPPRIVRPNSSEAVPVRPASSPMNASLIPVPQPEASVPQASAESNKPLAVSTKPTGVETSSRRSSRRTMAAMTSNLKSQTREEDVTKTAKQVEFKPEVADLVPRVSRKVIETQATQEPEAIENSSAADLAATPSPATKETAGSGTTSESSEPKDLSVEVAKEESEAPNADLGPLPPATLPSEVDEAETTEEPIDPVSEGLQVTAASHRSGPEAAAFEPLATKPGQATADTPEFAAADVVEDVVEPPALDGEAESPVLDAKQQSNDLRGQQLSISEINVAELPKDTLQLSPPTKPIDSAESDTQGDAVGNQMRGAAKDGNLLAGSTSELPGIRVTTSGPGSILIRQNAEYEVRIENRGEIDADGVLIRALIPEWADLRGQAASHGAIEVDKEGAAERLIWTINQLPAGASETMTLRLTASRSGNYDLDIDWTLVPHKSVTRVQVREPRLNLTIEGPEEVVFGESQTYKVRVLNPGNGTASNVIFTLSPNSATPQSQKIGDIPPGKEAQFDVELTAQDLGDLKIHGLAAGELALRAEAEKTIRVSAAKLEAVLTGPQVKYQNTDGLYSLQIQNHGDAASQNIIASLRLPSGVQYLGGFEEAVQDNQFLRWNLEQLAPGAVRTYQFRCTMSETGEHLFAFDCRGTAAGAAAVSIATRVESIADLVLSVSDPVAPAPIGTDVPYEIVIRNRGSKEATDVRAIAQFSHGVEPNRIEGHSGEVMTGQVLFDAIPRIGAGEEVRVRVIAKADRPGHHRFRAEIRSGDTVLVAEEATHYMSPEGERVSRRSSERLRR